VAGIEEDGVDEAEARERTRGWQSALFILDDLVVEGVEVGFLFYLVRSFAQERGFDWGSEDRCSSCSNSKTCRCFHFPPRSVFPPVFIYHNPRKHTHL
jgi:hypothetical protein